MRSGVKDMKRSDRYNNILRKKKKYIPVMLGVCMLGSALSGCGFVANPMQYMKDADKELAAAEQNTDNDTSGSATDSSSGNSKNNSNSSDNKVEVTDNKVIAIGTYGSISDMVNTTDYKSQADIECIQETRDFDDTSDMLALVKKVQESCNTDAESVIVSVRSRVYNQIVYLLQHTISTSKGLIVINEDGKDTDYNKVFDEALKIAVNPQSYVSASAVSTNNASNSNSGNNVSGDTVTGVDNNKGNVIKDNNNKDNKTYGSYKVIEKLSDMDVIDISGINSLPYVNIIYDYIGNDAYAAQKAVNTSEAVVVVTESSDGSLSPDMSQLINDISSSIPVIIICSGSDAAQAVNDAHNNCIASYGMSAEEARIMAMLCLTQGKNINDWRVHFTQVNL